MGRIFDFFEDSFQPLLGGKKYDDWKRDSLELQKVKIRNKKLAKEFEDTCSNNGGFLTYAEFLQIDQFGNNGYHNAHKYHGFTPAFKHWAKAIYVFLSENNIHEIVELGPGDGNLAEDLFKLCEQDQYELTWHAVEIGDFFRDILHIRFKKYKKYLGHIVKTIEELPPLDEALIISSYCIDSIPPHLFINTDNSIHFPTNLLGTTIKDGVVTECILSEGQLKEKNISIEKGIYTHNNISFDLTSWKLSPYQRAYIITEGFELLIQAGKKVNKPTILVIDEFRKSTKTLRTDHFLPPLHLNKKNRHKFNPRKSYERSGELLLYYPIYLESLLSVLKGIGLNNIKCDVDPKLASELAHKTWKVPKQYVSFLCFAILATGKINTPSVIPVSFPENN